MVKSQYVLEIIDIEENSSKPEPNFPLTKILQDNNNQDESFTINETDIINGFFDCLENLLTKYDYETLQQKLEECSEKNRVKTGEGWLL